MIMKTSFLELGANPKSGEALLQQRSIKIPRFLAVVGGTGILPKAALAVPGGPWVWSLGLFSSIFFLHIHKQKKKKKKKKRMYEGTKGGSSA